MSSLSKDFFTRIVPASPTAHLQVQNDTEQSCVVEPHGSGRYQENDNSVAPTYKRQGMEALGVSVSTMLMIGFYASSES